MLFMDDYAELIDGKEVNGQVLIDTQDLVELRRRDARLTAMEAAGVDNWEGMDHVEFPED